MGLLSELFASVLVTQRALLLIRLRTASVNPAPTAIPAVAVAVQRAARATGEAGFRNDYSVRTYVDTMPYTRRRSLSVGVDGTQPELDDGNGILWDEARKPFLSIGQVRAGSELPIASNPHAGQWAFDGGDNRSFPKRHDSIDDFTITLDPKFVV